MLSLLNIHDNVYINMERSSVINLLKHDESIISDLKNDLVLSLFLRRVSTEVSNTSEKLILSISVSENTA